ncbi:TRAP transporter substrate-binding protein DctP [Metasolibacillus sp.]|uniref:TRAP transporter substrate-binding protein DctP n=1 Tax=Metasolibacillus sp. TaxID=2703680 RepID=UPI0025FF3C95|nr:TRAP transporter substrate-binding protein DctP [Metasolibacillus sp.]MCT6924478.1 TRAP transporter substrate-binding protein DctP [Metasolibacillus sp.]MCT6940681.1 TRAP transporter substrate-binding protein DctP [Metasolibacillus sp.]
MKKLIMVMMSALLMVILAACGSDKKEGATGESGKQVVLDLSIPEPEDAKFGLTAKKFKEEIEKLTDNQVTVKIHANNSLGGEREVFELMGMGSADMAIQSVGPVGNWVPEFNVLDLPFIFDNREHAYSVLDGEIGEGLSSKFETEGNVKTLGWLENGFVATTSNNAINSVEDVKKMKIRVQENEIQIDTWKAFGAEPTPMAWTEVFTGLQQGVIDGHSNSLATIQSSKIFEVQDYVAELGDRFSAATISISTKTFNSLTPEQQEAVVEAGKVAAEFGRQANQDKINEAREFLLENGNQITEPDKESFKATVTSVYEKWAPKLGEELIEKIQNTSY